MSERTPMVTRRGFIRSTGLLGIAAGVEALMPADSRADSMRPADLGTAAALDGRSDPVDLRVTRSPVTIDGRRGRAISVNGSIPGPAIRFREGAEAIIRVTNELDEDTSIHWHGILVPNGMDGVPGVTFPGIRPGETFEYRIPVRQYGTYWYHSHSGLQEQLGHYGPLIVEPEESEPFEYDRDYVVVLSDWTFENPYRVLARLKKSPDAYNFQKRTVADFLRDASDRGLGATLRDRLMWGGMRMSPTDISDVTGATYTYLMNGHSPDMNWTALFEPGQRVRLRFINAAAATYFDVRIPGLPMRVVQVSGQHVQPVETDEFRLTIAETCDVIVEPGAEQAWTVYAEAMDRSGYARGTLAVREGMEAAVPERRARPLLAMSDMGMAMQMSGGAMEGMSMGMDSAMNDTMKDAAHMAHMQPMQQAGPDPLVGAGGIRTTGLRPPGTLPASAPHGPDRHGPGSAAVPERVSSRLDEPGVGLGEDGWRVLVYRQLRALRPNPRFRAPDREIELHLTGSMERYMWSINGVKFSDAEPIPLRYGERLRLTLVNDTMMNHPMHLHGMWMELENGHGEEIPRVHTVNVKPAERLSVLIDVDAPGPWAFHCHILYHMEAGMFRVVRVSGEEAVK